MGEPWFPHRLIDRHFEERFRFGGVGRFPSFRSFTSECHRREAKLRPQVRSAVELRNKRKTTTPMNNATLTNRSPLARVRFTPIPAFAAAGLLLGGLGTATSRATILYASDATSKIEKYTSGGVGSVFASSGLSYPFCLAFDSTENLYAGQHRHRHD